MQLLDTEAFDYFTPAEINLIKDKVLRYSLEDKFYDENLLLIDTIIFT